MKSLKFAGIEIPGLVVYIILAFALFLIVKLFGFWKKVLSFFGFGSDEPDAAITSAQKVNDTWAKDPGVIAERNTTATSKANQLYNAMAGAGTNYDRIVEIFKTITGPNQLKAVSVEFGIREIPSGWFFGAHKGDLLSCLQDELSNSELSKKIDANGVTWTLNDKLKWLQ